MPMPNSSTATVDSCAFCAPASAGSFATSGARSQATRTSRRYSPLSRADQIRSQQQRQRGWKLYSFHAPEVECIGKGKASAPYEFGVKASVVNTNARAPGGQFVLHARTLPGNPYDGHTLGAVIEALRGSPAARSSVPMSTRDIAATVPQTRTASSSQA